ncbi:DDE-type integrase/transposase/recombinase [Thermus sp.]|uniref:DDE-type integrase/transposase/recombinase n=2 Tax=Thermus sp. TaxID=275 RepID=UPI00298ED8B5|nr:DDE-type integrase/transposase/recombinase [Thermus sp.]MDW8357863.1 DDE-type integrase/transposase/recombinase [Thermus sp.]
MPWLPIEEAAKRLGITRRGLEKRIAREGVPTQKRLEGRVWRTYVWLEGEESPPPPGEAEAPNLAQVLPELHAQWVELPRGLRWDLVREWSERLGLSRSYLSRLLRRYGQEGARGLERRPRRDKGRFRVPGEFKRLLLGLRLAHPQASVRRLLRIMELNDPSLLRWKGGLISETTARRVLAWAERNPAFRYALQSEEGRRELLRTWHGSVLAEYPNQLWMVDMTRCDTFVYLPEEDRMVRLRIHVAVDVFSGAVPALVFSREEGQTPTNQLLILALQDKTSLVPGWDVWGRPEQIFWDNGRVYRSQLSEQIAERLGIELVYSRPRVSHTRGKVERFFGLFHQEFERLLPGYAGQDATERDSAQLARLLESTRRWYLEGMPPDRDPYPNRLLLEEEYKRLALAWLLEDWHRKPLEDGLSRLDLFRLFVPQRTLVRYELGDLYLLTATKTRRVVRANGAVHYRGRPYVLEGGSLIPWQGMPVWVLEVNVLPGQPLKVALEGPDGSLEVLGNLVPEPLRADSPEAKAQRALDRAAMQALREEAERLKEELSLPAMRLEAVLERLSGLAPLARRERVVPTAPKEIPKPSDTDLQQALAELDSADDLILDPIALGDEFLRRQGLL